jgi:Mg-chelatase subunit ChlD
MARKLLGLSDDGRLVIKLPGGAEQPLPKRQQRYAFLLIDCSGSMNGSKLSEATQGASTFAVDAQQKNYSVGLIRFATDATLLCQLNEPLSTLRAAISALRTEGSTNMADAIRLATEELKPCAGARAIVIATDGMPDDAVGTIRAADDAKALGIDIIAIGTEDADQHLLSTIASRSDLAVMVQAAQLKAGIGSAVALLPGIRRER